MGLGFRTPVIRACHSEPKAKNPRLMCPRNGSSASLRMTCALWRRGKRRGVRPCVRAWSSFHDEALALCASRLSRSLRPVRAGTFAAAKRPAETGHRIVLPDSACQAHDSEPASTRTGPSMNHCRRWFLKAVLCRAVSTMKRSRCARRGCHTGFVPYGPFHVLKRSGPHRPGNRIVLPESAGQADDVMAFDPQRALKPPLPPVFS